MHPVRAKQRHHRHAVQPAIKNTGLSAPAPGNLRQPQAPTQAKAGSGILQGMEVQLAESPLSALQDAADEMTSAFSTRVQEKNLRERKMLAGNEGTLARERVQEMLKTLWSDERGREGVGDEADLLELAKAILKQPGCARQAVREFADQPSTQYLTLLEVAELIDSGQAGEDPGGVALLAVREAAAELLAERGPEIRADLNAFDAAQTLPSGEAAPFRSAYRDVVLAADSLTAVLRHVLDAVQGSEGQDFKRVLDTMVSALGMDLAAARPSTDPVRLRSLVSDLFHLEVVSTVIDGCGALSALLTRRHGAAPFEPTRLAADLVALSGERWLDASRFTRLTENFGTREPATCAIDFLSGARKALKDMPVQVFATPDARAAAIDAVQSAIDEAVEREESGL